MLHLERRELMATVVSAAALATLPASAAKAQSPLGRGELHKLVISQRARTRLLLHMDLMIYALMPYIFLQKEENATYDDFSKAKGGKEWRESMDSFYAWFGLFDDGKYTETLLKAIDSDSADELISNATNKAEKLVSKVATVFAEIGIAPEKPAGSEALRGITTVEQLNALNSAKVPEKPFLCGFFPFSYFCD